MQIYLKKSLTKICNPSSKLSLEQHQQYEIFIRNLRYLAISIIASTIFNIFTSFLLGFSQNSQTLIVICSLIKVSSVVLLFVIFLVKLSLIQITGGVIWMDSIAMAIEIKILYPKQSYYIIPFTVLGQLGYYLYSKNNTDTILISSQSQSPDVQYENNNPNIAIMCMLTCLKIALFQGIDQLIKNRDVQRWLHMPTEFRIKNKILNADLISDAHSIIQRLKTHLQQITPSSIDSTQQQSHFSGALVQMSLLDHRIATTVDLLQNLQITSRIEAIPRTINTYAFLDRVWKIITTQLQPNAILGNLKIGRKVPESIVLDSHRLQQLILIFISNIIKDAGIQSHLEMKIDWLGGKTIADNECFEYIPVKCNHQSEKMDNSGNNPNVTASERDVGIGSSLIFNSQSKNIKRGGMRVANKREDSQGVVRISIIWNSDNEEEIQEIERRFLNYSYKEELGLVAKILSTLESSMRIVQKKKNYFAVVVAVPTVISY